MDAAENTPSEATASKQRSLANLRPWTKGQSGNAQGRPKGPVDIAALARVHGPRCIEVAAELLEDADPRIRLAALVALLDRGFGRPAPAISGTTDMPTMLQLMHHEAASAFSEQLAREREAAEHRQPLTINGAATKAPDTAVSTSVNLLEPALE
jgi:hypothetical protein